MQATNRDQRVHEERIGGGLLPSSVTELAALFAKLVAFAGLARHEGRIRSRILLPACYVLFELAELSVELRQPILGLACSACVDQRSALLVWSGSAQNDLQFADPLEFFGRGQQEGAPHRFGPCHAGADVLACDDEIGACGARKRAGQRAFERCQEDDNFRADCTHARDFGTCGLGRILRGQASPVGGLDVGNAHHANRDAANVCDT